jgi:D-alanyl-D-alanine carboxypeptidase
MRRRFALSSRPFFLLAAILLAGCQTAGPPSVRGVPVPTLSVAEERAIGDPRYAGMVVETATGRVLYSEDADQLRHPASLAKLMTLYLLFEAIEQGRLSMTSELAVSAAAAAQPPSKIGVKAGETIRVRDAILALCVRSANDVAVVVAETLAGSEPAFAQLMTAKARALQMGSTTFRNASGLPDPPSITTARDIAVLARRLQVDFPSRYHFFSTKEFRYADRDWKSTNQLLGAINGVDGMKTGYIRASGYNLVASAKRRGKRVIVVVMGEKTGAARDGHVAALVEAYLP